MAPINKNPNMTKKQTGTVPKTTSLSSASSTSAKTAAASTSSGTTKHSSVGKSPSSRKNTEIVVPVRREIKDLNDYFLSVAETTKQQNSGTSTHLDTTCFDLDNLNFQENQRFCWPVRPIPRRNIFNKDLSDSHTSTSLPAAPTSNVQPSNYHLNNNNNSGTGPTGSSNLNSAAAVGVVIPTTPNTTAFEDNYNLNRINVGSSSNINQQQLSAEEINSNQQNIDFDSALTWEQRLKFIQYFLSLTSKTISKDSKDFVNEKMVNERKESEILVNSTSLEDVEPSETSDTRAQSVTSIHTLSGPATPTYEELHSKLETSNRNIQNIKDQQQQLLKLQQAAKQHLVEMEQLRGQAKRPAHFNQNGSAPPDYESVEQVHSDMSNLVSRMKNLTTFIQGQNELSSLLGEDGPEILAEQEALQRKLEDLKTQRQEMKNLVSELQEINNSADKSIQNQNHQETASARVVPIEYQRVVPIELVGSSKSQGRSPTPTTGNYQQQNGLSNGVTNGIHNGAETSSNSEEAGSEKNEEEVSCAIEETTELIQQKMADINSMKSQLRRLKEMMDTVRMIEEKTEGKDPREIGIDLGEGDGPRTAPKSQNREPSVSTFTRCENDEILSAEEEAMTEKVRMLHEMTQDLREQAVSIASERDRLKAIKDEMKRQKDHLEIKNRDENSARIVNNIQANKEAERELLKAEYETKKKEFEKLCQRLQSEDDSPRDGENEDDAQEADTTERTENKREQLPYFTENWRRPPQIISADSSVHGGKHSATLPMTPSRGKDSADSGAADVHGVASLEAGSLQSGSSRSFSMPPPMRTLNNREVPWRKTSHDNSQSQFEHYSGGAPPPAMPMSTWNPFCHYNLPCTQHCHHGNSMSDCICGHQAHGSLAISNPAGNNQQQMTAQHGGMATNDPMLLQQFIQTQQMLINSVCQCNQLLWHQQREINNLNNAVLLLQERLLNATSSNNYELPSIGATNRAESVPPTGVTVANNLYTSGSRAPSEQPHPQLTYQTSLPLPPMSPSRPDFHSYNRFNNSYQQHRRNMNIQQNNNHMMSSHAAYNFASAEQGSSMYSTNNCAQLPPLHNQINYNNSPQMQQQTPNFLNNDGPNSGNIHQHHPAPPIFMHHHNNTITPTGPVQQPVHPNNNSNLLSSQQNCLNSPTAGNTNQSAAANASSTSAQNTSSSNAAAAAAALNNQVPPGNRANNYWDNFRSYSRQNLLSSNSCKSNEEQNQQQLSSSPFGNNTPMNTNSNGLRNLQHVNETGSLSTNNLTPPTFDNKYIHTFRNQINVNAIAQSQQHPGPAGNITINESDANISQEMNPHNNMEPPGGVALSQQQVNQQPAQPDNLNENEDLFNLNSTNSACGNNNNSNNVAAIFGSPDFRNMNFNFGANELRKKIPIKTSCSTKRLRPTQSAPLNGMLPNNHRLMVGSGPSYGHAENFSQHQIGPQQFNFTQDDVSPSEGAVGIDETSDEIKRNLLVNALKSDKFTSKFFESLKEDVYREVYSVILATECHPHYLNQFFKELLLVPTSDPLRNIVMQAMHDLYKRSCTNDTESNDGYNDLDFPNGSNDDNQMNSVPSPMMQNNENIEGASSLTPENNRDNEIMNGLINSPELRRLAYKIMFESRSPTRMEKGKKAGIKYDGEPQAESLKIPNEFYRPDYELVNHVMFSIRSSIRSQNIDDGAMIRIAKLTFSILENLSPSINRRKIQIDRSLISPKELYKKIKSFEIRDRESFLIRYEAYLQTLFVMKIINEDANNINLANRKSHESVLAPSVMALANALSLSNEDVQHLRRHAQACKSNIPIIGEELQLGLGASRKNTGHECAAPSSSERCLTPQQIPNTHHSQPPNLITSADVALVFNTGGAGSGPPIQQPDHASSPCISSNNNIIMDDDLAEADQICSTNSTVANPPPLGAGSARGSFSSDYQPKRPANDNYAGEQETTKEDCVHFMGASYQGFNREAQPTSTIDRENLEDGYDGLAYGSFHPDPDENNSEIISSSGNVDPHHSEGEAHSGVGASDSSECSLGFTMMARETVAGNSEACAIPDSSSGNNSHIIPNTASEATVKRNSVP